MSPFRPPPTRLAGLAAIWLAMAGVVLPAPASARDKDRTTIYFVVSHAQGPSQRSYSDYYGMASARVNTGPSMAVEIGNASVNCIERFANYLDVSHDTADFKKGYVSGPHADHYHTRGQAEDSMMRQAAESRRAGNRVVMTGFNTDCGRE